MFKVVIDTNVIISSLIFFGKPGQILELAQERKIQNITSRFIVNEVENVLLQKFLWDIDKIHLVLVRFLSFSKLVEPQIIINVIPYTPDNRILECAIEGKVDYIISGDKHLKDLIEYQKIKIITPSEFLEMYK
ncbi:MAG: putative toxin-antitoxin system toxin component, PIN family [Candidatus Magnetoovum sp. WYHC-5]|nr:putative toxin-antitoxin system toxin component, PIN family [Candidatus Magnetoovum sp. WYHC-5]